MHSYSMEKWTHQHSFTPQNSANQRKTFSVVVLTGTMMTIEIIAGSIFGSMALLADGWHMGTHAAALGIAYFAYRYASRHSTDPRYTFGTGKINVLGGFTSAVVLQIVAIMMGVEAVSRLFKPQPIQFGESIPVAVIGLIVNLISIRILGTHPDHDHSSPEEHHTDHNLKAAYLHVLADATTSVLAIFALVAGWLWGLNWVDPLMGIVGGVLITFWAVGLLRDTSRILLDGQTDPGLADEIRSVVEKDADNRISDLHTWQVGENAYAAIVSLVTHFPQPVEHYRQLLQPIRVLKHLTIEVNVSLEAPCIPVEEK